MSAKYPNAIKCVFWEATERQEVSLRRYISSPSNKCSVEGNNGYHHSEYFVGVASINKDERRSLQWDQNDVRWPMACACGEDLSKTYKQTFVRQLYRNIDTGEERTLVNLPVGAMWDAHWNKDDPRYVGSDGLSLNVKLPNGNDWCVDGIASNCDMPNDRDHKCWVRHGNPMTGELHVDKNGVTCAAGAGSIVSGDYHGFLHNGSLTAGL